VNRKEVVVDQATFVISPEQVKVMAAGLYTLANADGIDPSELAIIRDFVTECGEAHLMDDLSALNFDPVHAYQVLETSWLRRVFLRSAILMTRADGHVSAEERDTFGWICSAFGVSGGYDDLVQSIEGQAL